MDQPNGDETLTAKEDIYDCFSSNEGPTELTEIVQSRTESLGEDNEHGDERQSPLEIGDRSSYLQIPFGFQSRGSYKHASKNCEIVGVTHNSRFRQFVFLDSRGITSWSYESVYNTVTRHLNYPSYQFNVLRLIVFSRKFNVYFALSKEYALKVFNLNFHEVFSVSAEMHSVLCMVFNHGKDELITGGTGGMKFWTFGQIDKDKQKAWERDSRPMANYGLVLRASYPDMGGSWVKQVELDEAMQRLYCLSERNVVAFDMEGNLLFQILDAHRGPVTGCVYSKACNFLVTVGTDCDVNVWSRSKNGGKVHTFTGHSKAITKIMLHPETSALVITAAMDGIVKVSSLDFMEDIYSLPVFSEGIYWMNTVSPKLLYCCSNRVIEVFSLNHLCDFWALSRCSVMSLSLVTCRGKSTRVMAVGNDSSVRLISRKRQNLSTVLPPPPISPLNMVKDVAYNREFNMMYLLIDEQEIWVYYTRTNPATLVESWKLDFIEDIHSQHSQDALQKSRAGSPWPSEGKRSPSPVARDSPSLGPSSYLTREVSGRESSLSARKEKVVITCLGMLYSPIIMQSVEGQACPDATQFLMAGTQDGRVLFLHMFWQGLKYHQLQANKDAVLEVYHDQVMNTLVAKCRHPGIVILIWSLPFLELLKRIDCDADMTCFTRMNNLLLCGHKSGYLHLHSLAAEIQEICEDERIVGSKRPPPRDHQASVSSVDSNSNLEIFCSASRDGVIKIWDRDKALLREIMLDETLTVATFLNNQGDILIGFKQHIFVISNKKVYPSKDGLSSALRTEAMDDDAFETESDIYEDPSVRFESKKILQPDPTNMENYLVPFPNLQLKTSWFMEGRPPPDLDQQVQQDDEESISFMSDSLSLAPTEVYYSPSTTPRRLSLASSVAASERRASTELWELPEFGESPVSSPPRTPPPEPTPPSTPPPEEESEEEQSEEENSKDESQQINDPSCGQCTDALKKDGKKKAFIVPSFRREGGRMGNISIDSRSLRSGYGGPGYAAPVERKTVVQKPEPKISKPRRAPRPVVKKTKKPKESGEEEAMKETENKEGDKTEKAESGSEETNENKDKQEAVKESEDDDSSYRTPHVVNMPEDEQRTVVRKDTVGSRRAPGTSATSQEQESLSPAKDEKRTHVSDTVKDLRTPQDKNLSTTHQKSAHGDANQAPSSSKIPLGETGESPQTDVQYKADDGNGEDGEALQTQVKDRAPKRSSPEYAETPLVTYIDPDTGEVFQRPADEVPDEAEILDDNDEGDEFQGIDDHVTVPAEMDLSSSLRSKRSERGQKRVSFTPPGFDNGRPRRSPRQLPDVYASGRDSPTLRMQNAGSGFKETVVPVYDSKRPGDIFSKFSKSSADVSPLTIFALARSRRENEEKAAKSLGRNSGGQVRQKQGVMETNSARTEDDNVGDFELDDDDFARLMDKMDLDFPGDGGSASPSRPASVKKTESTLMRWCIRALKKADREVLFPPKPSRPSSSPSSVKSKADEKEGGSSLYLNIRHTLKRPQTADSIRSNATSNEEYSVFPYEHTASTNQTPRKRSPERKSAPLVRLNTWKHISSDDDEDFMDAYRAMRSSIGLHESGEDYMKDIASRESAKNERDIPVLDTSDYSGNWQSKVLERANRLKQQRLQRQKSATERRQALERKQRERGKPSNHFECGQEPVSKSENVIEFIAPTPANPVRNATPLPPQDPLQNRLFQEQEFANERPYRLRLNPQSGGLGLNPVARNLMSLKTGDHHVSDVANALPKPPPSASIPSKCSRYVLLAQPDDKQTQVQPTAMEETLLMLRFPKSRVRKHHSNATIPRLLSSSSRNLQMATSFEM